MNKRWRWWWIAAAADDDNNDDDATDVLASLSRLADDGGEELRQAIDRVSDIDQNAEDASRTTGRLSFSVYAMLGWVSLVTVAIAAVAVVTLRRRRRPDKLPVDMNVDVETERRGEWTRSLADDEEISVSSSSQVISVNE